MFLCVFVCICVDTGTRDSNRDIQSNREKDLELSGFPACLLFRFLVLKLARMIEKREPYHPSADVQLRSSFLKRINT